MLLLTRTTGLGRGYQKMLGAVPELATFNNNGKPEYVLYIPIPLYRFFIPLISLQYHQVKIRVDFLEAHRLIISNRLLHRKQKKY